MLTLVEVVVEVEVETLLETLVLTDVDAVVELNEADVDILVLALEYVE